jgi:hypothetical protein
VVVDGAEALRRYARSRTPAQAWGDAVEMAKGLGVSALEGGIREANKIADEDGFDLTRSFDRWVGDAVDNVVDKGKAAYAADRKARASGRREDYKGAVMAVGGVTAAAADGLTGGGKTKVAKAALAEAQALKRSSDALLAPPGYKPSTRQLARTRQPMAMKPQKAPAGVTGSSDATRNIDVTYNGKHPHEWTAEEKTAFGELYGLKGFGDEAPMQVFLDMDGKEIEIPGGLEGRWSHSDLLRLKGAGIDPSRLPEDLHIAIQQKLGRTMTDDTGLSDGQVWSGAMFGMTSPNNPLFPNQMAMSRLRMNNMEDVSRLAEFAPWNRPGSNGAPISPEDRRRVSDEIAAAYGLNSGKAGGLGVRGTTDYSRVADFAHMFRTDPEWMHRRQDEPWSNFAERVISQVPGFKAKTGMFGTVWQDPGNADVSAMDRHMVNFVEDAIFTDPQHRASYEARVLNRVNKGGGKTYESYADLPHAIRQDGLLEEIGKAPTPKFRNHRTGEISGAIPEHLAGEDWISEPESVQLIGDAYKRGMAMNAEHARERGVGLFNSQWHVWDRIRRRLEPHENMYPGLERLPRMSVNQLRVADDAHRRSGHKNYTKTELDDGSTRLNPTKPVPDWRRLTYFGIPAAIALPMTAQMMQQTQPPPEEEPTYY